MAARRQHEQRDDVVNIGVKRVKYVVARCIA
jgi:hypothetical protein